MKRTDTHRPLAIVPTEYEYVGIECLKIEGFGDCQVQLQARARIQAHMKMTGGHYARHEHGGNCMVCGSVNAIYTHLFYHAKSNSYVRTGTECTDRLDYAGAAEDMDAFKHAIKPARELHKGKRKAEALLEAKGLTAAWVLYTAEMSDAFKNEEITIRSIVATVVKYGGLSDKQSSYLRNLLSRIENRAANAAKYAAQAAVAADCPTGRVTFTGKIVSTRDQESDFGPVTKMLVVSDTGFKVWVTMPSSCDASRGDSITITCTVTPSKDDAKFGFGKRPIVSTKVFVA